MRANNRRLLLHDGNPQTQSPRPSTRTQAAAEDAPASARAGPLQFDSSSMAVTALVLLCALFFLGFLTAYARCFFDADHDDDQSRRRLRHAPLPPYRGRYGLSSSSAPALDPLALRALPVLSYSGAGKEQTECVVCLSEFVEEDTVKAIPGCGHVFHPDCIDAWLLCHGSCPLCRSTQLFGLISSRGVRVDVRGWVAEEQRAAEDGAGVELARATEVDVEVGVAVEEGGSEEREHQVEKELRRVGRSDSWRCSTLQGAVNLRRSRSW